MLRGKRMTIESVTFGQELTDENGQTMAIEFEGEEIATMERIRVTATLFSDWRLDLGRGPVMLGARLPDAKRKAFHAVRRLLA